MDNYKKRQQQEHGSDLKSTSRTDEGRRRKTRMERETRDCNNHDSSGKISNFTSSSLHKKPHPNGGGGSRDRSPRPRFEPQTNGLYETSAKGASLPPQQGFDPHTNYDLYKTSARGPSLPPWPSANEKKVVNWCLACFMCNEYLTRGTLLRRSWTPCDWKPNWHESDDKSQAKSGSFDQDGDESRRQKERVHHTITDFLQPGDVHLPGIVNPSLS